MTQTDVLIVGGGLAGLYTAFRLQADAVDFQLLEARERLGGRVLSLPEVADAGHRMDLGPTWFWPHQRKLLGLLRQLEIAHFEQYDSGDVLYELSPGQAPQRHMGAGAMTAYRMAGGMGALIDALALRVDQENLRLGHRAVDIRRVNDTWQVKTEAGETTTTITAQTLILAIPPRVALRDFALSDVLSSELSGHLSRLQTWMAAQAKCVAVYSQPFWREQGLSGDAFSRVGPMTEIHDAGDGEGQVHALFGFIGVSAAQRKGFSDAVFQEQCLRQLGRLFGEQAMNPSACHFKDWAADPLIATDEDIVEQPRHPEGLPARFQNECVRLGLHFASTEVAAVDPGYLEGALHAAEAAVAFCGVSAV